MKKRVMSIVLVVAMLLVTVNMETRVAAEELSNNAEFDSIQVTVDDTDYTFDDQDTYYEINISMQTTQAAISIVPQNLGSTIKVDGTPVDSNELIAVGPFVEDTYDCIIEIISEDETIVNEIFLQFIKRPDDYGTITIDESFPIGELAQVIASKIDNHLNITSLTITEGILNQTDILFIGQNLINLQDLYITGNAQVHNTVDTVIANPDNTLPDEFACNHANLRRIEMDNIIELQDEVLYDCQNLESVSFPNAEIIGIEAFSENLKLTDIEIPKVKFVGDYAFSNCSSLSSLNLPLVTALGQEILSGSNALNIISLGETVPTATALTFQGAALTTVKVPSGAAVNYLSDPSDGNDSDQSWYGLNVDEPSNDATFEGIEILFDEGSYYLDDNRQYYNINLPADVSSVNIIVSPVVNEATINIDDSIVGNGEAFQVDGLEIGSNEVIVTILSEDKSTTNTITLNLKPLSEGYGEVIIDYTFNTSELSEVLPYECYPGDITSLTITEGIINRFDTDFLMDELVNLEELIIAGNGRIDSRDSHNIQTANNKITDFNGFGSLRMLQIDTATIVGECAFEDDINIESIILPEVTNIGMYAFAGMEALTYVEMPKLNTIAEAAFQYSVIESASLPNVELIGDEAFESCNQLISADFPKVVSVGECAFYNNTALTDLNMPLLEEVGEEAFYNCDALTEVELLTVEVIEESAFADCENLTVLRTPNLQEIGYQAFYQSNQLSSLYLGIIVPSVETDAFEETPSLNTVKVPVGSREIYLADSSDGDATDMFWHGMTPVELSSDTSFTSLEISFDGREYSFEDNLTIYEVKLPPESTQVEVMLQSDADITSFQINGSVGKSGDTLIIDQIPFGENIYEIIITAEDGVSERIIPLTLNRMETGYGIVVVNQIFEPGGLLAVIASQLTPNDVTSLTVKQGILNEVDIHMIDVALSSLEELYIIDAARVDSLDNSNIDEPNDTLDQDGFRSNTTLKIVVIDNVKTIEQKAFLDCTSLESISFENLEVIGDDAFINCSSLKDVNIPLVKEIGESAFTDCVSIEALDLPLIETIDNYVFMFCTSLKEINAPNMTFVGLAAFEKNYSLEKVSFSSLTYISDSTFKECGLISEIHLPSIEFMDPYVFDHNEQDIRLILGQQPPMADVNTFSGAIKLTEVVVPYGAASAYLSDSRDGDATDDLWYGRTIYELDNNADVDSVVIENTDVLFDDGENKTTYTFTVSNDVEEVDVTITATSNCATVFIEENERNTENVSLNVGVNVINARIVSEDKLTINNISIEIIRKQPVNTGNNGGNNTGNNSNETDEASLVEEKTSESIITEIQEKEEMNNKEPIQVSVAEVSEVEETVFEALKDSGSTLVIEGDFFQWEFDGTTEGSGEMSGAFSPKIEKVNKEYVDIDLNDDTKIIIKTEYRGELPFKAKLKINLDNVPDKKEVFLYYYNEETGKMELSGTAVCSGGQAEFELTHCSIYAVNDKPLLVEDYMSISYISGYSDNTFRPDSYITRAEAAVIFGRIVVSGSGITTFNDIDMWAKDYIRQLADTGLIKGYADGSFRPNKAITRAEFSVILTKMLGVNIVEGDGGFTDTTEHWAKGYIHTLETLGIISGYKDGSFRPDAQVTRAEAVVMINRALGRTENEEQSQESIENFLFLDVDDKHWAFEWILNASGQ